ncbi:conserved hypothetical protein [Gloeothece citriformis PCC 7424]|uniref:DUF5666 domain-containing protein n=1 Tax=Gloeothece citriformis (strain PCC 7424) TaxID=65393 RepID=B7K9A7_GLOC7|nr:hypothetical protein [Gloeothece citriformis]ACK68590.1 conserved hypothetical protein [Gloeothece citriformis PCC 7424]
MSMTVTGKIEHKLLGMGAWALVAEDGTTYELKDPPSELKQDNLKVQVTGNLRDDVMTIAMIGPVLEVSSFEVLE